MAAFPGASDQQNLFYASANIQVSRDRPSRFQFQVEDIRQQLPPDWTIRLPEVSSLTPMMTSLQNELSLHIFSFANPSSLVLKFFQCDTGLPECTLASITLDSLDSEEAQEMFHQHRSGTPLQLSDSLVGYWLDTHHNGQAIASIMWQQDGLFYTVRVPARYRTHPLRIAQAIAIAPSLHAAQSSSIPTAASATPAPEISAQPSPPHFLDTIQQHLPPDWAIRLPADLPGRLPNPDAISYDVRVFAFDTPPGLAIGLFRCESVGLSCLAGSFSVDSAEAPDIQHALQQHQSGQTVSLSERIQAYALSQGTDNHAITSLMWQDGELIYTLRFPRTDYHHWLAIAQSTVQSPVITASHPSPQPNSPRILQTASDPQSNGQTELSSSFQDLPAQQLPSQSPDLFQGQSSHADLPSAQFSAPSSARSSLPLTLPHRNLTDASPIFSSGNLGQVTSVSQLSDVAPTDWAYQALQTLLERYGCVAGYPDETYRGNRSLSRYEFAAGLNACLDRVSELIQAGLADMVNRDDLDVMARLQEEFAAELTVLQGQVANLEERAAQLEAQQFSTTMRLFGASTMAVAVAGGGDPPGTGDGGPIFAHQTQLNLLGSLTEGRDLLRVGLSAANFDNGGFAGSSSLNTNMALLSFQSDTDNDIELSSLEYRFSALGDRIVFTVQPVGFDLGSVLSPNSPLSSSTQEAISRFAEESPLFRIGGLDAGVGFDWLASNRVRVQAAYGSRNASNPGTLTSFNSTRDFGGFAGNDHNALGAQVLVSPVNEIVAGIGYINGFSRDGRLDTGTGSFNADTSGNFNEYARIHAVSGTLQWQVTDRLILGGWGGLVYTSSMESDARAGSSTYAASLKLEDVMAEGDLLAFFYGRPLRLFVGDRIERVDEGRSHHFEVFYRFRLSDHISLTPGVFYITDPGNIEENDDIVVGVLRTTLQF